MSLWGNGGPLGAARSWCFGFTCLKLVYHGPVPRPRYRWVLHGIKVASTGRRAGGCWLDWHSGFTFLPCGTEWSHSQAFAHELLILWQLRVFLFLTYIFFLCWLCGALKSWSGHCCCSVEFCCAGASWRRTTLVLGLRRLIWLSWFVHLFRRYNFKYEKWTCL